MPVPPRIPPRPPPLPATSRIPLGDLARWVVVAVLVALLMLAVAVVLWRGISVLLEAFAGLLLALFLATLSDWLSRASGISYRLALVLITLCLIVLAGGFVYLLANRLALQIGELVARLPQSIEQIRTYLEESAWGKLLLDQIPRATESLAQGNEVSRVTSVLTGVMNFLTVVIVVFFVGIFGAAEPAVYREGFMHLVPHQYRQRVEEAIDAVIVNLRYWLVGQVALIVVMWLTTTIGLWLIGVPLALTLGLIAGVLELIPYIGPLISFVPAALMALLLSPTHLVLTVTLFLLLHVLEGYVFLPLVQRKAVHLSPALTLVTQILLGELMGLLGLFVAAPLTVAGVVLLKMLYVEDTLGDQDVEVMGEPGNEPKAAG